MLSSSVSTVTPGTDVVLHRRPMHVLFTRRWGLVRNPFFIEVDDGIPDDGLGSCGIRDDAMPHGTLLYHRILSPSSNLGGLVGQSTR
jgi:hypothetical protein